MGKRIIQLTESDLHRIVAESVSMILNETSTKKLAHACVGSQDKTRNAREKYGNGSNRHEAAKGQLSNFQKEWNKRYEKANTKKRAVMDQAMDDAYNAHKNKVKESVDEIKGFHGSSADDWDEIGKARFRKGVEDADETSIGNIKKGMKNFTTAARLRKAARMRNNGK